MTSSRVPARRVHARVVRWRIEPRGAARGRTVRESVIVQVTRPSGAIGYGEAAPLLEADSIGRVLRALRDSVMVDSPSARFALEAAELDALARECGERLIGPVRRAVVVDTVHEAIAADATCLKVKVGASGDLERIRAIAAAAPRATLRVDANRTWPRETVRERMAALADLPIEFIEEPCVDAISLDGLPLKIALDESLIGFDLDRLDPAKIAAVVLKPTLLGGIAACRELASRARVRGIAAIVTHALEGPIGTAACIALARAIDADDRDAGVEIARVHGLAPHSALDAWDLTLDPSTPGLGLDIDPLEEAIVALADPLSIPSEGCASSVRTPTPDASTAANTPGAPTDDAIVALAGPLSIPAERRTRTRTHAPDRCIVATPTSDTIAAIHSALDERRPFAMLHAKTPEHERARQSALAEAANLEEGDVVLFTSGSTGAPRGVVLSRDALIAATEASRAHLGWRDDDRWLLALSTAHAGGLAVVVRCLAARRDVVLVDDQRVLADKLVHCTLASLVPTQLAALLEDPAWQPPPLLRAVLLGGAAASPSLLAAAAERGVPFLTTYGMTETFGQIATASLDRVGDPSAPLVPLANVAIEIGVDSLIRVRTPQLARCYLDGEPIAPVFATRDLGVFDRGLRIIGRFDDVIITGGENVHPQLVEAVLAATPGVRAACAFGIADERWGQRVVAALAVDEAFELAGALANWKTALPAYALPREVATVRELPVSPNGKLDRRAVVALPRSTV